MADRSIIPASLMFLQASGKRVNYICHGFADISINPRHTYKGGDAFSRLTRYSLVCAASCSNLGPICHLIRSPI